MNGYFQRVMAVALVAVFGVSAFAQESPGSKENSMDGLTLRFIETNGIRMRIAEMGEGPLVLLIHGFPESWYSWRHQLRALAKAGYRAVAPDMRGYGKTDAPEAVEDYDIVHLSDDVAGIIDALGEETAVIVGHDWGAYLAWNAVLLQPDRYRALIAMSVPYGGRSEELLTKSLKEKYGENFFYILYFQEPGVAEAEFDADPRGILSRMYLSPHSPREARTITDPKRSAGGWIGRLGAPKGLPDWLTKEDLDYYVSEFTEAGFRGGVNYYRNFDRNWEITPQLEGAKVEVPVLFVAGEKDGVIRGAGAEQLRERMGRVTTDLRDVLVFPGIGHWVQQEVPERTNAAMITFLDGLDE